MKIHGLQKMTLLDFPEHVACTVFLGGCDLRCPFCHNFELVDGSAQPVMDDTELLTFLSKRKGLLDGVAFTGGEPCLHKDLPELIRKIRDMGFSIKLDTNGLHPDLVRSMTAEGLVDYIAMDIKNSPEKYALTGGVTELDMAPVFETIDLLLHGETDYEFRTTVVREFHEADDFEKMGEMIRGARRYFLQCFTDRDSVPFEDLNAPSPEELEEYAAIMRKYLNNVYIRGVN